MSNPIHFGLVCLYRLDDMDEKTAPRHSQTYRIVTLFLAFAYLLWLIFLAWISYKVLSA